MILHASEAKIWPNFIKAAAILNLIMSDENYNFESHSIVFLDLENLDLDTKIMILAALGAKIWEYLISMAAILNFGFLRP